jgi:two-component system chemotaxis sensor kinase CheA
MELDRIREAFAVESGELLAEMEGALLHLDFSRENAETVNTVLRAVHTIKGSSMIVGAKQVEGFTHIVESVLVRIRQGEIAGGRQLKDTLLRCKDHIAELIKLEFAEVRAEEQAAGQSYGKSAGRLEKQAEEQRKTRKGILRVQESLLETLGSYLPPPERADPNKQTPGADDSDDDEALDFPSMPAKDAHLLPSAAGIGEAPVISENPSEDLSDDGYFQSHEAISASSTSPTSPTRSVRGDSKFIRVDTGKLDALINSVGELVIASNGMVGLAEKTRNDALSLVSSTVSRLTDDIRAISINMRMVSVADTFKHMERVVHDICAETGKEAYLEVSGQDSELDKNVMEKITDPLVHLVRNAVDHGIEPVRRRIELGKPRAGRVALSAYRDVGSVVIEITDDGRGIDRERVFEKAVAMGFIRPDQSVPDKELFGFIFTSGFSTAENVTTVSGRGVGMDVVKNNIESIRGSVEVESRPGEGSTVRLRLPLTLSIIEGLIVGVADAQYIVPMEMVTECAEFDGNFLKAAHSGDYISFRGETIPYVRLGEYFSGRQGGGCGGHEDGYDDGHAGRHEYKDEKGEGGSIVIVLYAGQKAGLVVDRLYDKVKTVIKPLSRVYKDVELFSGASILSEGTVALVIDVPKLMARLTR